MLSESPGYSGLSFFYLNSILIRSVYSVIQGFCGPVTIFVHILNL